MKTKLAVIAAAVASLAAMVVPVTAHHSFAAEYDANKPITIKGTVTKVEWTNPHARFYVDVKDANGKVSNWNLELASPNVLKRSGWTRTSLKEGDSVTVEGAAAKDGSNMANARAVTMANGKRVFAGSSGGDGK
jgi:DNA/RNA endonuclease YhcR with UshA esterase domain